MSMTKDIETARDTEELKAFPKLPISIAIVQKTTNLTTSIHHFWTHVNKKFL